MSTSTHKLNELIEILRDGKMFYDEAATKVSDPSLRTMFHEMSATRSSAIADLTKEVRAEGDEAADGGTMIGTLSKVYANALAAITSDKDTTYVNQLEAAEDRLLHAFEGAAEETDSPKVREILSRHAPEVRRMHDQMRSLKHQRNAA